MSFAAPFALDFGPAYTGLTLRATLVNANGSFQATDLTFVTERKAGTGIYGGTYASFPNGWRGGVVFHNGAVGSDTDFTNVTPLVEVAVGESEENAFVYHAAVDFCRDQANSKDEWTVSWYRDGVWQTSGITSPTLQVVKRVDGTDLIAATAMTQIGSTGSYKYDEATNRVTVGEAVLAVARATIDGATRTWLAEISRDSTT